MNKIIFILFILAISIRHFLQTKDIWHYIENEQVIGENKETAHASFTSFSSEKEVLSGIPKFKLSLDGLWKFKWVRVPKVV